MLPIGGNSLSAVEEKNIKPYNTQPQQSDQAYRKKMGGGDTKKGWLEFLSRKGEGLRARKTTTRSWKEKKKTHERKATMKVKFPDKTIYGGKGKRKGTGFLQAQVRQFSGPNWGHCGEKARLVQFRNEMDHKTEGAYCKKGGDFCVFNGKDA